MRYAVSAIAILGLMAAAASGGAAQGARLLQPGRAPSGVEISLTTEPYELRAETASAILEGLRALAPGAGWVWFPYQYGWRTDFERVLLSDGTPSTSCRPDNFRVTLDFRAAYPVWIHGPDAPEELVAAWAAFEERIKSHWEYQRARAVARARQVVDAARRLEEPCVTLGDRVRFVARQAWDEEPPERLVNVEQPGPMRWPPDGFLTLMVQSQDTAAPDVGQAGGSDPADPSAPLTDDPAAARAGDLAPDRSGLVPDPSPRVAPQRTIAEAVQRDLDGVGVSGSLDGLVVGYFFNGEDHYVSTYDSTSTTLPREMLANDAFAFRAFTEVLMGALAGVLDDEGVLDVDGPISAVLPELDGRLGSATLEQLLSHRAGLDNSAPGDALPFATVVARLGDRALVTDPGILYSHSRYSYGLALRVMEAATGTSIQEAIQSRVLAPLGLAGTTVGSLEDADAIEGLPVTQTTAEDLVAFWTAWWSRGIPGSGALPDELEPGPAGSFQTFYRGAWVDRVAGVTRLTLVCRNGPVTAGFHVLPDQKTMLAFGGHGAMPLNTGTFILARFGQIYGLDGGIFGPGRLDGGGVVGEAPQRCLPDAFTAPRRALEFGLVAETGNWAGRYLNGDRVFVLEDRDGELVTRRGADTELDQVHHFDESTYFVDLVAGVAGFPIRLLTDHLGRRYVVLDHRAYIHEDDRTR